MEVSLLEHEEIPLQGEIGSVQNFNMEIDTLHCLGMDNGEQDRVEELIKALGNPGEAEKWTLDIQVKLRSDGLVDLGVRGELLKRLHQLMYSVCKNKSLKMEVAMQAYATRLKGGGGRKVEKVCVLNVLATALKAMDGHGIYRQNGNATGTEASALLEQLNNCCCQVSVKVDMDDWINIEDPSFRLVKHNRWLLESKFCADFKAVAKDGTGIPCHKIFLAESPVLMKTLQKLDELSDKSKETSFGNLSSEGLSGFLEYLYFGGYEKALDSPRVCLELLEAGYQYELPALEKLMRSIIVQKGCKWWTVDTAIHLYKLHQSFGGSKEWVGLGKKAMEVLEYHQSRSNVQLI